VLDFVEDLGNAEEDCRIVKFVFKELVVCLRQLRVVLQRDPSFPVSEEVQLLNDSFLSLFSIRFKDDVRLLKKFLSEGSLVHCRRALARWF